MNCEGLVKAFVVTKPSPAALQSTCRSTQSSVVEKKRIACSSNSMSNFAASSCCAQDWALKADRPGHGLQPTRATSCLCSLCPCHRIFLAASPTVRWETKAPQDKPFEDAPFYFPMYWKVIPLRLRSSNEKRACIAAMPSRIGRKTTENMTSI